MADAAQSRNNTTLWQGDIEPWMDEPFIKAIWANLGEPNASVRIIKDRVTGNNVGYCFVDFPTHEMALHMYTYYNGQQVAGLPKVLQLRWAAGNGQGFVNTGYYGTATDLSIFVGDLAPDVTDLALLQFFQKHYSSIRSAKVATDPNTGLGRGFGYVRFMDEGEYQRSVTEIQGQVLHGRCIKVSFATVKKPQIQATPVYTHKTNLIPDYFPTLYQYAYNQEPTIGIVHVIGLSEASRDYSLRKKFEKFGPVIAIKFVYSKKFREAFITFEKKADADSAIEEVSKDPEVDGVAISLSIASNHILSLVEKKLVNYLPPKQANIEYIKDLYDRELEEDYSRYVYLYPTCGY